MAIVISKNSTLNDDIWNEWAPIMVANMQDADTEKNNDDALVKALYNVRTSKRFGEKAAGMTEFGNFEPVEEGGAALLDDVQEGFPKLITHTSFMKKAIVTAGLAEDNNVDEIGRIGFNMVRSYKRSRADFASRCLVTEGSSFTYGTRTFDKTTGDAKGLFATDHPGKRSGVAAQSNVFTNAFGTDSVMLNRLANIGRNFKNTSGEVMGYTFDTIIIPGNVPVLEDTVKKIIRSDLTVGSNYNDVNTQKGLWNLIVDHRWTVASGAPYILMSSEANREMLGSVFYDRIPLTMKSQVDIDTQNLEWSGRARFSAGFYDWRHILMGGASAGTTLT